MQSSSAEQIQSAGHDLAAHLRQYEELRLAEAVEAVLVGNDDDLVERVMELFRHGMGGILDRPLRKAGVEDRDATARRDELADRLYSLADRKTAESGLVSVLVDLLPLRLWRPANLFVGGRLHFCSDQVRTVEWNGRVVARGRADFPYDTVERRWPDPDS